MNILTTIKRLSLVALLACSPLLAQRSAAQPGISLPVQTFYNELAPYGQWLPSPNYGSVWVPNVGPDFQPYATNGHWVVTEFGNTWVSDYPWGWAPFHYGRWYFDNQYGWAWVPGSDWGPAWVSWRSGGGYYGWAPLGPGWDIDVNTSIPAPYWTFVPQIYITSPSLYSYRVSRPNVVNIYQNTTIINNVYRSNNRAYVYGPPRGDIERITRRSVPVYRIDPMDRPGRSVVGNGSVGFYRPGTPAGYGQDYQRNDRFDNAPRPNYGNNGASDRGAYDPSRGYTGGNANRPNRNDEGGNGQGRNNYGRNYPADRSGSFDNPSTPNSGNYNRSQPERSEPNRGSYSPGNGQPGGFAPQSNRPYERAERQEPTNSQAMPGGRSESGSPGMSDNRGRSGQQPSPRPANGYNSGGRDQRGPR